MNPYVFTSSSTASASSVPLSTAPGIDFSGFFLSFLGNSETGASLASSNGILHVLGIIWTIFVVISFLFSIAMLVLYAYASSRRWQFYAMANKELRDAEDMYDELYRGVKKNDRMKDILMHIDSLNPNDWKLAIIEADIILDDLLKQQGYAGMSLGERLKSISPTQLNSLNDAWEAHKVRNRIAHDGADFVLTKNLADETINRYQRVFRELGI